MRIFIYCEHHLFDRNLRFVLRGKQCFQVSKSAPQLVFTKNSWLNSQANVEKMSFCSNLLTLLHTKLLKIPAPNLIRPDNLEFLTYIVHLWLKDFRYCSNFIFSPVT